MCTGLLSLLLLDQPTSLNNSDPLLPLTLCNLLLELRLSYTGLLLRVLQLLPLELKVGSILGNVGSRRVSGLLRILSCLLRSPKTSFFFRPLRNHPHRAQ